MAQGRVKTLLTLNCSSRETFQLSLHSLYGVRLLDGVQPKVGSMLVRLEVGGFVAPHQGFPDPLKPVRNFDFQVNNLQDS